MQMTSEVRDGQTHAVELRKDNARELAQLLKALAFREIGSFHFSKAGLRLICDDQHCEKAIAYIETGAFSSFVLREEAFFRCPLQELSEILGMFDSSNVTVKMTYDGFGEPLRLQMVADDDEYIVQANIHTLTTEPELDFGFMTENLDLGAFFKPDVLREAIKSIDESCSAVRIHATSRRLSFVSTGDVGKVTTSVPSTSELVERIDCSKPVSYSYRVMLIKRMQTALSISQKISLRIDTQGVMCVQFLPEQGEADRIFIEFYCVPDEEEDEEDDE